MPRLRGFMGYWYPYLWDSSESLFSLLVFLPRGWNSGPQSRSRSNRDSGPLNKALGTRLMNPLTTRLRCLLLNLLPHLTGAKRVFWPYIIYKTKKFLEKKFQWPNKYTKCRVSDFLTRYYSTDLGIIETTLKTSFSRSHFRLFFFWANLSFPQKREKSTYSSGEKAWRRRDQPALQARITWLMIFTSRNVGFFPFQFRIVLAVLRFFKERLLAISLSASLKLSFWGSSPREFCHYIKIWPSVWINRLAKVTWYDLFRSFL